MSEKFEVHEGDILGPDYVRKTDDEIRSLALQLYRGEIFTSMQIDDPRMIGNVFMPIMFMDDLHKKMLMINGAYCFYANMEDAGPRAINGYPCFFSMMYLDREDAKRLIDKLAVIEEMMDNV